MLFATHQFILVFLPLVYGAFYILQKKGSLSSVSLWLLIASFLFYLFWNPSDLLPLVFSILVNYGIYKGIQSSANRKKHYLVAGIFFNLAFLCYFKYIDFFFKTLQIETSLSSGHIPLGISFYTFTQIAFLIDCYRFSLRSKLVGYSLFVSYFPHLVCGPIINFNNFYPQLSNPNKFLPSLHHTSLFILCFSIGLFKKLVLADPLGSLAGQLFDVVDPSFDCLSAWMGTVAYALQLYFDFSGYSDMAVGISYLFGLKIPDNFNAPYQSASIIDFWRRWHISLSEFLKNHLYIPLGGGKVSPIKKYRNLLTTMLLGGLWHGASWTFVAWGGFHGCLLIINHMVKKLGFSFRPSVILTLFKRLFVFMLVCLGWVLFRAESFELATGIYKSLFGLAPGPSIACGTYFKGVLLVSALIAFLCPDTMAIRSKFERWVEEEDRIRLVLCNLGCVIFFTVGFLSVGQSKHFLYAGF